MSETKIVARNPFDTLTQEHEVLRDLLGEYPDLDTMAIFERRALLRRLEEEIASHIQTQERLLFPALVDLNDSELSASIAERVADHRALQGLLIDVREAHTPLLYDLAMIRLRFNTQRHLEAEEKEIYKISSRLSAGTLNRLSRSLEEREEGWW